MGLAPKKGSGKDAANDKGKEKDKGKGKVAVVNTAKAKGKDNVMDTARKDKGKNKVMDTRKDTGKGKTKENAKGKTIVTRRNKGKSSTMALRDEPTASEGEHQELARAETSEVPRRVRRPRSHSTGIFGKIPPRPIRINISGGHIEHDEAKKTLLAIVRERWPIGHYTFTSINDAFPDWCSKRVAEFKEYYKHEKGQSRSAATRIIEKHVQNTVRRTMQELKKSVDLKSKESGVTKLSLKPPYWSLRFWKDVLNYWENDKDHLHRSVVGSANRKQVSRLHSAGARSFNKVKEELRKQFGKPPTLLQVWDKTHTRVGSDPDHPEYTTPAAMQIATRYASILESMPVTVTQTGDRVEPLQWWLLATGVPEGEKPKKNYLVGFPQARATDLIPTLASRYRDSTRGEASSSSGQRQDQIIPDNVYLSVVRNVLTEIRANPHQFHRQLSDEEIANFAKTALEASDPAADPSQRLQWNSLIANEMVHIVGSLVEDMVNKIEQQVQQEKERAMAAEKDYTDPEEMSEDDVGDKSGDEEMADAEGGGAGAGADAGASAGAGAGAGAGGDDGEHSDSTLSLD